MGERRRAFVQMVRAGEHGGYYPFFRPVSWSCGAEVEVGSRRLVMVSSNDYLGLAHDPRVLEAAAGALRRWGSGPGGSRFLSGNTALHDELERRVAGLVGKRAALVHTTGFCTNLGVLGCLLEPGDAILCDRENHASILEGCRVSGAHVLFYRHNDLASAAARAAQARRKYPQATLCLVTDGVFSMSADIAPLPGIVDLARADGHATVYVDDAHGIGVLGETGGGTTQAQGVSSRVDFIMGTFSKALASIGGFVACDDEDLLTYVRHHSRTLIFSAALPPASTAAVLAALDVVQQEPERRERLRAVSRRARAAYRAIGIPAEDSPVPIIPVPVGDEHAAYRLARDLFEEGVFALPSVFPAVPRGHAILRTVFTSLHEDRHVDHVAEALGRLVKKHGLPLSDAAAATHG
jgi:glycine C-acetyltransferase